MMSAAIIRFPGERPDVSASQAVSVCEHVGARSGEPPADAARILAVVCAVMEVSVAEMPGKSTPRTRPRLHWARNMAAYVMHDLGLSDGAIAAAFGRIHRITILVRRRRMAEKLETTQRYRDHHAAILARLAVDQPQMEQGGVQPLRAL